MSVRVNAGRRVAVAIHVPVEPILRRVGCYEPPQPRIVVSGSEVVEAELGVQRLSGVPLPPADAGLDSSIRSPNGS